MTDESMAYLDRDNRLIVSERESAERLERSPRRGTHVDGNAPWYWRMPGRADVDVAHVTELRQPWREFHETFTICNVVAGPPVEWRCRDISYTRAVDRLMLVGPGDLHLDVAACAATFSQILRLPRYLVEAAACEVELRRGPAVLARHETRDKTLMTAVTAFHAAARSGVAQESLERRLQEVVRALLGMCRMDHGGSTCEHVALRRAREYMRNNLASELSLDEIAAVARMSKFQLVKLFGAQLGCAPHQYHVYMRVARARHLLAQGRLCSAVAHEVGFTDQSHLNRWFARLVGVSPGAYKQRCAKSEADA